MRLLAIDTVGPVIGVAACSDEAFVERTERLTRRAEARLVPWAVALLDELNVPMAHLDGIAVAVGPGAFTGLRVGIATAAGLAQAIGCPVWQGCSLASRARASLGQGVAVLSLLDARKGRVYAALYDSDGRVVRPPADVEPAVALGWAAQGSLATGEGAVVYADQVRAAGLRRVDAADDPGVSSLARAAVPALLAGGGVAATAVRPVYLRAPDAKPRATT